MTQAGTAIGLSRFPALTSKPAASSPVAWGPAVSERCRLWPAQQFPNLPVQTRLLLVVLEREQKAEKGGVGRKSGSPLLLQEFFLVFGVTWSLIL